MRGHSQTSGRIRHAVLAALLIAPLVGLALRTPASADDAPSSEPPPTAPRGGDALPVALGARRIRHWSDDGTQYVLLEDQASVFQGPEGLRALTAVVKIAPRQGPAGQEYLVEIFAEGKVVQTERPGVSLKQARRQFRTTAGMKLNPIAGGGRSELPRAPAGLPILARAFPRPAASEGLLAGTTLPPRQDAPPIPDPSPSPPKLAEATPPALPDAGEEPPPVLVVPKGMVPPASVAGADPTARGKDDSVKLSQFVERDQPGFPTGPGAAPDVDNVLPGPPPAPPLNGPGRPTPMDDNFGPSDAPPPVDTPGATAPAAPSTPGTPGVPNLDALPGQAPRTAPIEQPKPAGPPIEPGTQRVTRILSRSGQPFTFEMRPTQTDGTSVAVITGGVNLVTTSPQFGTVDIEADRVVIWVRNGQKGQDWISLNNEIVQSDRDPMEVYMEGHVIFRQDSNRFLGKSDQKAVEATSAYYDYQKDQFLMVDAQVDLFAPGLISPLKIRTPRVMQYHPMVNGPNGLAPSQAPELRAEQTVSTGSRFARPGYRFRSSSIDVRQVVDSSANVGAGSDPNKFEPDDLTWLIDARQNAFYMGRIPIFYWPRFVTEADDLDIPLRQINFRTNNYFGQQVLTDWNMFKLLNIRRPREIDQWNLDIDYLSARDKKPGQGIAVGSEIGWFGNDLIRDIRDPYHRNKSIPPSRLQSYAGYFDIWGLRDGSYDTLGPGPAVITQPGQGKKGYSRTFSPPFQEFRGRFVLRHMQSLLRPDADPLEDFRINLEAAYVSDRQFLEQYYKRLFDTGLDQETLAYLIRQKENWAFTVQAEANLQDFNTESQWLPKLDYYRIGDSFLGNLFTHYSHTGVDYANVHTANEVNNPNIFAFIPYDPISNTTGTFESGRAFTTHEIDMPINLNVVRVVPYVQGQAIGWNNQINGDSVGRLWGAAGARADVMAHRAFPYVNNELLNIHGLNHKINFLADYRTSYSNVGLNSLGIQDDLDDNTYEQVRRYFALTTYNGGILPAQYDPRFLLLRRGLSPITGPNDIQDTIQMLRLGIHQRLQTQRGPIGKRRIIDWMVFDVDTTFFPNAKRDNFGKSFGQTTYNWEWFIGDRTSIVSYGWFEQFDITGSPINPVKKSNDPLGLNVITAGISMSRPPRANVYLGYSIINTGTIATSAINASYSYWMSPKWYSTFGTSYDFGNKILLGANVSLTRVGADYLTTVGLAVDPQRQSYLFSFEIAPRLSPNLRFGSGAGLGRLDTRFAPVE